jgi:hypothetical protein
MQKTNYILRFHSDYPPNGFSANLPTPAGEKVASPAEIPGFNSFFRTRLRPSSVLLRKIPASRAKAQTGTCKINRSTAGALTKREVVAFALNFCSILKREYKPATFSQATFTTFLHKRKIEIMVITAPMSSIPG